MALTLTEDRRSQLDSIVSRMDANGESPDDIKFVVEDFKSKYAAENDPSYLSQLGSALDTGLDQAMIGTRSTWNALTGDREDLAANLAAYGRTQQEVAANQTPADQRLTEALSVADQKWEKGDYLDSLTDIGGAVISEPGAAFKTAVQSAPNAIIGLGGQFAGRALGVAAGGLAGSPTGPGAVIPAAGGYVAGGVLANSIMEAGPAIWDALNERTGGRAAQMSDAEIKGVLDSDPTIMTDGLLKGATRGSVIGLIESLGLYGAGRVAAVPARTALGTAGRLGAGAAIETGAAGVGEAGAQLVTEGEVKPSEVAMEMVGEVGLSPVAAAAAKSLETAAKVLPSGAPAAQPEEENVRDFTAPPPMPDVTAEQQAAEAATMAEIRRQAEAAAAQNPIVAVATDAVATAEATASVAPETSATLAAIAEQTAVETLAAQPEITDEKPAQTIAAQQARLNEIISGPEVSGVQQPATGDNADGGQPGIEQSVAGPVVQPPSGGVDQGPTLQPEPTSPLGQPSTVADEPPDLWNLSWAEAFVKYGRQGEGGNFSQSDVDFNIALKQRQREAVDDAIRRGESVSRTILQSNSTDTARAELKRLDDPLQRPFRPLTGKQISKTEFDTQLKRFRVPKSERDGLLYSTPSEGFQYRVPGGRGTGRATSSREGSSYKVDDVNRVLKDQWERRNKTDETSIRTTDQPGTVDPSTGLQVGPDTVAQPAVSGDQVQTPKKSAQRPRKQVAVKRTADTFTIDTSNDRFVGLNDNGDRIYEHAAETPMGPAGTRYTKRVVNGVEDVRPNFGGITLTVEERERDTAENEKSFSTYLRTVTDATRWTDDDYTAAQRFSETGDLDVVRGLPKAKRNAIVREFYSFSPEAEKKQLSAEEKERKAFAARNKERPDDAPTLGQTMAAITGEPEVGKPVLYMDEGRQAEGVLLSNERGVAKVRTPEGKTIQTRSANLQVPVPNDIVSASGGRARVPDYVDSAYSAALEAGNLTAAQQLVSDIAALFNSDDTAVIRRDETGRVMPPSERFGEQRNSQDTASPPEGMGFTPEAAQTILSERLGLTNFTNVVFGNYASKGGLVLKGFVRRNSSKIHLNLPQIRSADELVDVFNEEATHLIYEDPAVQQEWQRVKELVPQDQLDALRAEFEDKGYAPEVWDEESYNQIVRRAGLNEMQKSAFRRFWEALKAAVGKLFGVTDPNELNRLSGQILRYALQHQQDLTTEAAERSDRESVAAPFRMSMVPDERTFREAMEARQSDPNLPGTPAAQASEAEKETTRARFQPPNEQDQQYVARPFAEAFGDAEAYVDSVPLDTAVRAAQTTVGLPAGMEPGTDRYNALLGLLIERLTKATDAATDEFAQARIIQLTQDVARLYTQEGSQEGRALGSRAQVNARLLPIMPILAARKVLIEKATRVVDQRFDKDPTETVRDLAEKGGKEAGANLSEQLDNEDSDAEEELNRAQRTAESLLNTLAETHSDPMGWKAKGQPDPVRALYYRHLKAPMDEAAFVQEAVKLGVDDPRAQQLWQTSQLEINARAAIKQAVSAEAQKRKAQRARENAEKRASQLIYKTEERLRQGSKDLSKSTDGDSINKAFREQVTKPMAQDAFRARLDKLGVGTAVADRLFTTAKRESADRAAMEIYKEERRAEQRAQRRIELAEKQASQLIYRTEEKLRQGSKDLKPASDKDTINKAFREQVENPGEWDTFRDRLSKLGVREEVAARLFRTAERETLDQQAMEDYREARKERARTESIIAKDSPKLAKLLNDIRKKMFPGLKWSDILTDLPSRQDERQQAIYDRIRQHEALRGLSQDEQVQLTNELDKAWQRERRKVFMREVNKVVLGAKAEVDVEKVKAALPRLLRYINLGVFNSEAFREAIAPEYGFKTMTPAQAADLRKMAEQAWNAPEGVIRNRALQKMLDKLQSVTGTSRLELFENYWIASVLSGLRTQFDTWMATLNGFATVARLSLANPKAAPAIFSEWMKGLGDGAREALQILAKGDYSILKRFNEDMLKSLQGEKVMRPTPISERMLKEGNWWQKFPAAVMVFVSRSMAAADHVNNTATTRGAIAAAKALNPTLYKGVLVPSEAEQRSAREQATREVTGGATPTPEEKRLISVRTREILNPPLDPASAEGSEIGNIAAYQNDPTGLFGGIYNAINFGFGAIERKAGEVAEDQEVNKFVRAIAAMAAISARSVLGVRFARFGMNFASNSTSFVPGTYFARQALYGRELSRSRESLIFVNNLIGAAAMLALYSAFSALGEEDDDYGLEGRWDGLTPEKKKELMSAGKMPLTYWWRSKKDGKINRIAYRQWEIGSIFAAVGSMLDKRKYRPSDWKKESVASHTLAALGAGMAHVRDLSALSALSEIIGKSAYSTDAGEEIGKKINKAAANWTTAFLPNAFRDVDAWTDPQHYKAESNLDAWLKGVPVLRRQVSGGRPMLTILGDPVELDRSPWSRSYTNASQDEGYRALGALLARGIWLPSPSTERVVRKPDGTKVRISDLGGDAEWRYQKAVGKEYREYLKENGADFKAMERDEVEKKLERDTARIRDRAAIELEDSL